MNSKERKTSKLIRIIVIIILAFMVLFSLFLISLELGNSKELPSFLDVELYIVTSDSMLPRLKADDIVIVKKGYKNEEFKVRKYYNLCKV